MLRCPSCHRRIADAASCPRHGGPPRAPAPAEARAAPRVEGFRLAERLGTGGFAEVWAGVRARDGAHVAVKIGLAGAAEGEARFQREAGALERIGPPHAPRLHGQGRLDDGRPWIAMERLRGRTLAADLAALPAPPDPAWALGRADALLVALEAAHAREVVHRDVKPENVFLVPACDGGARAGAAARVPGAEERAVLLDFGLARRSAAGAAIDAALTRPGAIVGTPIYMAPEQVRGDPAVDARADIYAFGVILFELLTLRPPFVGDASAIEHGHLALRPPRPTELAPVPAAMEDVVLACLAKDPDRRPGSVSLLRRALVEAVAGRAGAAPEAALAEPPPSARSARLLAEGREPVVVLVADVGGAAPQAVAALTSRRGMVVRQRGRRLVALFSGLDAEHPAQAALAAARELVGRCDARAALHLARVTLRRRGRSVPVAHGAAVDRPEDWLPPEPWSGVAPSAEIERALLEAEPAPPSAGGATADAAEIEAPLLGRGPEVEALRASAAAAFDGTCPGLMTLIGDVGLGKTRLASEAALVARSLRPDALVVAMRAAQPLSGGAAREPAELLAAVLSAPERPPADVAAFCEARLGEEVGRAAWPAVAAALGWPAPEGRAPPRHELLRAIAEGLRRRARLGPVAVILDDADWADDALLDALELATLDGAGVSLWVVVAAHPRFEQLRPGWGTRTQRFDRTTLAPLDERAGMRLAAELLLPAEYPPADALRRLAAWAGGNPACLSAIVRALKRAGIVRQRSNTASYYAGTAAPEGLPPSPGWQWLAMRRLEALPPELAACARLCAVLGASFTRAELEWVQDAADRAGGAGSPVDAGFGLSALVERGILERVSRERYAFQSGVFRDSVVELLHPEHRKEGHRYALAFWRARLSAGDATPETLASLARHASACGACGEAAEAYVRLGDLALSAHRHVEADQHYTAALACTADDDLRRRALALAGRGRIRYRAHRTREAIEDLSVARELGERLSDDVLVAEILLEEATLLDWTGDYEGSARRVERARPLVVRSGSSRLAVRLLVADGRGCVRTAQVARAIALLERGAVEAEALGDHEGRIVALLLLSVELSHAGSFREAEERAREAIDLCAKAQDLPHLCVAYMNRVVLWALTKSPSRAVEDLRRAISLAREIGNPWLERVATYNVAELLYWSDRRDDALALARRAHVLERRFIERPVPECSLLLARILATAGQDDEARGLVAWVARSCPPEPAAGSAFVYFRLLRALLIAGTGRNVGAPAVTDGAAGAAACGGSLLFADELLEMLYWRARVALRGRRGAEASAIVREARAMLEEHPAWGARFDGLARALEEVLVSACTA
ncbi:protein kinase [Sorangium cellulosum]|uniref:Protein kinase n=1 Tax=Sorangium cellulosum TaxID=56 RepID=A0A4P2PTN9_SORCE|nr:serine/threonine-protein kinase [Sorangium cellulosum]AUX19753.1 protein kinase [Sorangium cellulosum]